MKTNYTIQNFAKRLVMVMTVGLMAVNAWGTTTLIFDFTSKPSDSWPTSSSAGNYTYTLNGTNYTFALGSNVYCNSGYLMLKYTTSLGLPAVAGRKLVHVDICNSGTCSKSTNVEVSSDASGTDVSGGAAQNFGKTSYVYRYNLSGTSVNTSYYLYITSANCQITKIALTYENTSAYKVTFDAEGGTCDDEDAIEASANAGITLPTATPNAAGWEFAGWADNACSETETAPRLYYAGDTYYPEKATTLHAVYRKMTDGTSTSTATFTASTLSGLTSISEDPYIDYWWKHTLSGVEFWINDYGFYNSCFNLDDASSGGYAMIYANRRIKQVEFTARNTNEVIDDFMAYDEGDVDVSTEGTVQTVTCSGNVTQIYMVAPSGEESYISSFEIEYYDTKFNSNPCGNNVTLSKGTQTNATISSFSLDAVATCSAIDADRQVTVTVAAATGYEFLSTARLTFAKTSGTASATYVSGPTGTGPYTWVYRFTKDDSGAGTFSVTSATPKSYTVTLNDNSGSGGDGTKTVTYYANTNMTSAVTIPTKTDYIFGGYWTSANSGVTLDTKVIDSDGTWVASVSGYTDATPNWIYAGNVTLYAKWTEHTYVNYRTNCCTKPTISVSGTGKSVEDGKIVFAVLREDLGGNSDSEWEEVAISISSNSNGAISIVEGTSGDAGKTAKSLSSWQSRAETGGTWAVASTHAEFVEGASAGDYIFKIKSTAKDNLTGQGTYRIGITQAADGDYCESTVWIWVDVTLRDKFVDAVNGNTTINKDGQNSTITTPAESAMDEDLNDACHDTTRRLLGWVKETDLDTWYNNSGASTRVSDLDDKKNDAKLVAPNTSGIYPTGVTWYAIWGIEE